MKYRLPITVNFFAIAACCFLSLAPCPLLADVPLGWVSGDMVDAYTQNAGSVEITTQALAVNDTIDFLNIRNDPLAGNRKLVDNSGDLHGWQGTLRVGLLDTLSLFYQRQEQDLTIKLGPVSSIDILDIDDSLKTTLQEAGVKWTFYEADFLNANGAITAATLELAWRNNTTDDFGLDFDTINFSADNFTGSINFTDIQHAAINNLSDDGWRIRFIYSTAFGSNLVSSFWAGYSKSEGSSGTGTTIPIAFLQDALTQRFDVRESQFQVGANINWQLTPRLPLQLSYEYININNQDISIFQGAPAQGFSLPGFLSSSNLGTDTGNHIFSGTLTYWITPAVNLGITGRIFTNQFLGKIPHYNNPLSAGFSDTPYGYVGLRLGLKIR